MVAKRLIAKAVSRMPVVCIALRSGKILLKGGDTVSALAEELTATKVKISACITKQGTETTNIILGFHNMLLEGGQLKGLDSGSAVNEGAVQMERNDVLLTGATAIDVNRRTAIMVAAPSGGMAGKFLPALTARGVTTIMAVGTGKLMLCRLEEVLAAARRETVALAMGSAVALVRLRDKCVTETEAINMLTGAKTSVIGARGIMGAEGSTTFVIEGKSSQVKKAWGIVHGVRGADVSGARESLIECNPKSPMCAKYLSVGNMRIPCHSACVYQQPELVTEVFRIPTSINKVIKVAQL